MDKYKEEKKKFEQEILKKFNFPVSYQEDNTQINDEDNKVIEYFIRMAKFFQNIINKKERKEKKKKEEEAEFYHRTFKASDNTSKKIPK